MLTHNISELISSPVGTVLDVEIDEPQANLGSDLSVKASVRGRARLHRTQRGVLAQCQVGTSVELECSRCLEPFVQQLQVKFSEEFVPEAAESDQAEDGTFRIDEHQTLDLSEPVRQYLTVALPLAPICRVDCPGLCPACGALLEGHECIFDGAPPRGPFAALAEFYHEEIDASLGEEASKSRKIPSR